jgi:hypothetical protein
MKVEIKGRKKRREDLSALNPEIQQHDDFNYSQRAFENPNTLLGE